MKEYDYFVINEKSSKFYLNGELVTTLYAKRKAVINLVIKNWYESNNKHPKRI